ncbi:MAG: aspartyl protease family protein [Acidobacteria bacterium]|nr:aspartyl protease family protein [Acidobacteriota bacterium]
MPADFIVDTGTNNSIVDKNIAQMLAFRQTSNTNLVAPGGTVATQVVEGEMRIPGKEFETVSMTVQDLAPYSRAHLRSVSGILGVSFLKRYVLAIDYENRRIEFLHEPNKRFSLVATIPFRIENGLPLVKCRFPNSIENDLIIDTGTFTSCRFMRTSQRNCTWVLQYLPENLAALLGVMACFFTRSNQSTSTIIKLIT